MLQRDFLRGVRTQQLKIKTLIFAKFKYVSLCGKKGNKNISIPPI
jgi:hypothetical protein